MVIFQTLMFNLSLLLVLLFFFIFFVEQKVADLSKSFYFFYFSISLIMCFLLSINVTEQYTFDLRQIPLTLGSLYMGPILGFWLLGLTVVLRGFINIDIGFWVNLVLYLTLVSFASMFHKRFLIQNRHRKVLWAALFSCFPSFISSVIYFIEAIDKDELIFMTGAIMIPILGTVIIIYTIESIREKLVYRTKMLSTEKYEVASQLSAAISHEVRNPLTVTRGFLQLLQEPSLAQEDRLKYSKIAIKELDRAEGIISDYLTFAKPTLTEKRYLVLNEELMKIVEIIMPLVNMNTVELNLDLNDNVNIYGDSNKFHQCILNILKNCVEAMPNGGKLTIHTHIKNEDVIIQITDTGIGMTSEQVQRLGEPYFSNKGIKGTGLGMMVTCSIIRAMKGSIHTESKLNKGTTFTLKFPIVKKD